MSSQDEDGVMECLRLLFTDEAEGNVIDAVANGDQEEANRKDEATGGADTGLFKINDTHVKSANQADLESIKTNATDAAFSVSVTELNEASTVPGKNAEDLKIDKPVEDIPTGLYKELLDLETLALLPNSEPFQCPVCTEDCEVGAGVVLRDCAHHFCRECLSSAVKHCLETTVACPATQCTGSLEEREIRFLSTREEYERWLARGLASVERSSKQTFHCRMRDCRGWAFCDSAVQSFLCPVCECVTCVPCQAIHEGETCQQHLLRKSDEDPTQQQSRVLLNNWIGGGIAMTCPQCGITITKIDGCDGMQCSACKTKICWATRGRRWGPGGAGDNSGGCRCNVNGKRCHPSCSNCH